MKNCETLFGTPFCGATEGKKIKALVREMPPGLLDPFDEFVGRYFVSLFSTRLFPVRYDYVVCSLFHIRFLFFEIVVYAIARSRNLGYRSLTHGLTNAFCKPRRVRRTPSRTGSGGSPSESVRVVYRNDFKKNLKLTLKTVITHCPGTGRRENNEKKRFVLCKRAFFSNKMSFFFRRTLIN